MRKNFTIAKDLSTIIQSSSFWKKNQLLVTKITNTGRVQLTRWTLVNQDRVRWQKLWISVQRKMLWTRALWTGAHWKCLKVKRNRSVVPPFGIVLFQVAFLDVQRGWVLDKFFYSPSFDQSHIHWLSDGNCLYVREIARLLRYKNELPSLSY